MSSEEINGQTFSPKPTGSGGETKIGDDLRPEAIETLGSYLSSITTDPQNRNAFPIDPLEVNEFSLRQSDGSPAEFTTGGNDGNAGFTSTMPAGTNASAGAVEEFETLSSSTKFQPELGEFLDKNSQQDGHNLLRDVTSTYENNEPGVGDATGRAAFPDPSGATPMQRRISEALQNNNRFDPMPGSSPYIEGNEFTAPGIPVEQGSFGVYNHSAERVSIDDMQKIAYSTLMRQTGHNMGSGQDPTSSGARDNARSSNPWQKGAKKVSTAKLRARNAYGAPARPDLIDAHLEYDDMSGAPLIPRKSVGALNNPYEPFSSPAPNAMISQLTTAADAFAEIVAAATVFAAVMSVIQTAAASTEIKKRPSQMKKGQYRIANGVAKLLKRMGIPETNQPIWRCMCYGTIAFFKIPVSVIPTVPDGWPDPASGPIGVWWELLLAGTPDILTIFAGAQKSHGYYATILRSIRRDLERLLSDLAPSDPPTMWNTIMHLNSYSSWRFFCTLAVMGDRYLDAKTKRFAIVPTISGMAVNGQTRQAKSRAYGGQDKLVWRHRGVPSAILLPRKYANAYSVYGFKPNYAKKQMGAIGDKTNSPGQWHNFPVPGGMPGGRDRRQVIKHDGHRLPKSMRVAIEDELDAEYMPFYFHDLRTNEVIAFPAFIEDVKDSYSVSYASSAGYGRIDPVQIYQNTARSISVSWTMVATSKEDFDSLWWSVNKLVSMLYPQFSMGKPVRAGNKKFVMPFSQIPTASPVIRLRVGDVIRGNYSRFNLARIFGMSEAIPAASAYGSPSGTDITEDNKAAWDGAPFDLTYMEEAQAAAEVAAATVEAAENDIEFEILWHAENEPYAHEDWESGYLPWDTSDWGLGQAILKANDQGYTTYDMDATLTNPSTPIAPGAWLASFPPETATSGINIEDRAFLSRTYSDGAVRILARRVADEDGNFPIPAGATSDDPLNQETDVNDELRDSGQYAEYLVTWQNVDDGADPYGPVSAKGHTHAYVVTSADLRPIYPDIDIPAPPAADVNITLEEQVFDIYDFFRPDKNAVVRSFEAAGGRGLAGVITSFDMDWKDSMWDMSGISRRAPNMVKCSISFSPIHDIVPGLDNNGAMRAYNYPVGKINSGLAEDFYSPGAGPDVTGGRMSVHRGTYTDNDANLNTVHGFEDSVSEGYGAGGAGSSPGGGTP